MDSLTGFDDDFFGNYDAEQAQVGMSLELDAEAHPPTPEQRAHAARFRRPVAGVVAGMALLSLVALAKHGSQQHGSQRELVAHYSSALAAPKLSPAATIKHAAVVPGVSSELVPDAWSNLVTEVWSALDLDSSPSANAATPGPALSETGPSLEPAPTAAPLTELFTPPDSSLAHAFLPEPSAKCLLPADSDATFDAASDADSASQSISVPLTIEISEPLVSAPAKPLLSAPGAKPVPRAPAKPLPRAPVKPLPRAPAKALLSAPAKPLPSAAAPSAKAMPAPFNSIARFPDAHR